MNASTEYPYLSRVVKKVRYQVLAKLTVLNQTRLKQKGPTLVGIVLNVLVFWALKKGFHFLMPSTPALPAPR